MDPHCTNVSFNTAEQEFPPGNPKAPLFCMTRHKQESSMIS